MAQRALPYEYEIEESKAGQTGRWYYRWCFWIL